MDSSVPGWWRRHGWTITLLLSAFGIGLLIRTVFMAPLIEQFGPLYLYGGGSDSFYHSRVMAYIIANHSNLVVDPLLRYPTGAVNPREPLFDWMNAIAGILFAPLFGGNAVTAGAWFLDFQGPLWASLGVFPIYLIGKEVTSKRAGIVAAFLYPLMVANIDSSTFGYANYLSFYTFFILLTIYGFLRTIRASGTRRWVDSYRSPRQIWEGLKRFSLVERTSVKWAVFTGVSFGALALAWQGYSFVVAAMVVFLIFALIVERIRRVDSFGLYVNLWIIGLVGFPMAMPYFVRQGEFAGWFDLPLLVYFGALLIVLPFLILRDYPWVVSVPVLAVIGAAAVGALDVVNHAFFVNIVTGQGYFVKTLVYSTVAEAQAPSIDALIIGFGIPTFFLAFVGLALVVYRMARLRFPRALMLFLVFGIISIYLPLSAAKFFYLGSAGFALLASEPIVRVLDVAQYGELRRTVGQLTDRRGQATAFRRAFKPRHVLIMGLVLVILLPNIWYAVDAGIPYNSKGTYNQQIYNTLPPFLRTAPGNASTFYLGAGGTQLDTPTQYDEAGYNWLARQDQNLPAPQRPAFISWWDYGFQAVSQGLHPTVADNFQNGIVPGGNFLLAQNESLAIGILSTTLLEAELARTGTSTVPPALATVLARDGVNVSQLNQLLQDPSGDIALVLAHPERYLPVDPSHLDGSNALYDAVSYLLASTLSDAGSAQVYNDIQTYTGWSIRYAMVDNRLFPFSGANTGIFYAPADLTDRVIGAGGAPIAYYNITVTGSDGRTYDPNTLPAGVTAVGQPNINYFAPFYNTMIYRTFIGYSGAQIGSNGIPGLAGSVYSDPVKPGWMLPHFQVVYRTAYYCPFSNPTGHAGCYTPMNLPDAVALAKRDNGSADVSSNSYFGGGETMLEYYPGQPMTGTVTLPNGQPVASARVTVYDSWNIPHQTTLTDANGAYSVVLPPGNDTVNVTLGTLDGLTQAGNTVLLSMKVPVPTTLGLNPAAPTLVRPVVLKPATVQGFLYWNTANNSSYQPQKDPLISGATVTIWGSGLVPRSIETDASGAFVLANVAPGVYNCSVTYLGGNFSTPQVYAGAGTTVNQTRGLQAGAIVGLVKGPSGAPAPGATVTASAGAYGVVATTVSNSTGGFTLTGFGVGNYSVRASSPAFALGSPPYAVKVIQAGFKYRQNLTMEPVFTLDLTVVANGNPATHVPVRFTPIAVLAPPARPVGNGTPGGTGGGSTGPTGPTGPSASPGVANSSVFYTDGNGFVSATLPVGNYSVYALGYVGSTLYAGFESAYVPPGVRSEGLTPLFLAPAASLHGVLTGASVSSVQVPVETFLYDAHGNVLSAFANTTGGWAFEVPSGSYSILAVQGLTTAQAALSSALTTVQVTGETTLSLGLVPSVSATLHVGFPVCCTAGDVYPATDAATTVTLLPGGASVTAFPDAHGNTSFVLPASVPNGGSYCLSSSAPGYTPYSTCGLSANAIQSLQTVPLGLTPVPVNVTVSGLPAGSTITLNVTAKSPTATSTTVAGMAPFSLSLRPGAYEFTAWGRAPTSGLWLPPAPLNATIGFGTTSATLSITVLRQVGVTGTLLLPSGVAAANVTVSLSSPGQNLTLGGAAYAGRFLASPGTYQYYASAAAPSKSFAGLGTVTIGGGGGVSGPLDLTGSATRLIANLTQPGGSRLFANASVAVLGPGGSSIPARAVAGQVDVLVPSGASYSFQVETTQIVVHNGVSSYQSFASVPGYTCVASGNATFCNVPLAASPILSGVAGTLTYPGYPGVLNGEVQFVGPSPSTNATTATVTNGSFSVPLAPGTYSVYATAGGAAAPVANLSVVTVGPTPGTPIALRLAPTWTDALTLLPPAGGVLGNAEVSISDSAGTVLRLPDQLFRTPLVLALPIGVYSVTATAPAAPYGVPTNATATISVPLLNGNAATQLSLVYSIDRTAAIRVSAPTTAHLGDGGMATFAFVVVNTGNAPETLHFVGTPSTFNFSFSPSNVSLGTASSNSSFGGEVTIRVPAGTPVSYPAISLEALLPSGQLAGVAVPAPQVALSPSYGIVLGASGTSADAIGPFSASLSFYVRNTGTITETVRLAVADATRLAGLGWSAGLIQGKSAVTGPVSIAAAGNLSFLVVLASPAGQASPPGSVTVSGTVVNGTQPSDAVVVPVPTMSLTLNRTSFAVSGPSVGSPPTYPDWLVPLLSFAPAIAVVAFLVVRRYLRTRRWSRR